MKWKPSVFKLWVLVIPVLNLQAQEHKSTALLPDHAKLQYAGNIGWLAVGAGYQNKSEKLEGDVFYGYVPENIGGVTIQSLTVKGIWFPFSIRTGSAMEIKPFSAGLLVQYTFGKQYFGFDPENYPYEYYKFPTAFHGGVLVGGSLTKKLNTGSIRGVGLYYELVSFDTELISYINNTQTLSLTDVLSMGIGIQVNFK